MKVFEEECELMVFMIVDVFGLMYFGKNDEFKIVMVVEVVVIIGFFVVKKKDKVGVIFILDKIE